MSDVLALDVANFQGADINGLLDAHPAIGRVVVRGSLESAAMQAITRAQCETVRARGLGLDTYVWCYATADAPATLAERARRLVGDYHPDYYWLDCEEDTRPGAFKSWTLDPAINIRWLREAVAGFEDNGLRVGIYSGYWFWTPAQWLANTALFSHLPLWNATDVKVPDRMQGWPYGGWEPPYAGVQYDLSGPDLDVFDGALYAQGDDAMTARQMEIARTEIAANILKALNYKLPKAAREALEFGALPAANTLARGEE